MESQRLVRYYRQRPELLIASGSSEPSANDIVSVTDPGGGEYADFNTGTAHGLSVGTRLILTGTVVSVYGGYGDIYSSGAAAVRDASSPTVLRFNCLYISNATGTWSLAPTSGTITSVADGDPKAEFHCSAAHGLIAGDTLVLTGNVRDIYGASVTVFDVTSTAAFRITDSYNGDADGTYEVTF